MRNEILAKFLLAHPKEELESCGFDGNIFYVAIYNRSTKEFTLHFAWGCLKEANPENYTITLPEYEYWSFRAIKNKLPENYRHVMEIIKAIKNGENLVEGWQNTHPLLITSEQREEVYQD